jgi:hypothetical protein
MTPGVLFRGMVYDGSGYADETRGIVFGLHRAGVPMRLQPIGAQHDANDLLTSDELEELELLKHERVDFARESCYSTRPRMILIWPCTGGTASGGRCSKPIRFPKAG